MTATPNYFFLDGQKLVATDNGDGTKTLVVSGGGGGGDATAANQVIGNASLSSIDGKIPTAITPGLLPVDTLGTPAVARVQATSGTAASIVLTTTCRRLSMYATTGTWYSISGTATSSSHYIGASERLDIDVPASTTVSVLQETSAGSIRISELT
jgi:hypothetical protein